MLEPVQCHLALVGPRAVTPYDFLAQQVTDWLCYGSEVFNVAPVEIEQAVQRPAFGDVGRWQQCTHGGHLGFGGLHAPGAHHVTQELHHVSSDHCLLWMHAQPHAVQHVQHLPQVLGMLLWRITENQDVIHVCHGKL